MELKARGQPEGPESLQIGEKRVHRVPRQSSRNHSVLAPALDCGCYTVGDWLVADTAD